jgi:ADP-heptose:LPS heptosyltransferase
MNMQNIRQLLFIGALLIWSLVAGAAEYYDIVITNNHLGDNVVGHYPYIGRIYEYCKLNKMKLRMWMPANQKRVFRNLPNDVEVIATKVEKYTDKTQVEFARQFKGVIDKPDGTNAMIFFGDPILEDFETNLRLVGIEDPPPMTNFAAYTEPLHDIFFNHLQNVYKRTNTVFSRIKDFLVNDADSFFEVSRLRFEVASWTRPSVSQEKENLNNFLETVPESRRNLPIILVNLKTAKPETDLVSRGAHEYLLNQLMEKYAHKANIVLAPVEGAIAGYTAEEIKKNEFNLNNLLKEMMKQDGFYVLGEDAYKTGLVDTLIGAQKTIDVITADTGLAHLAAAVRADRPYSVSVIFAYEDPFFTSSNRTTLVPSSFEWGIPNTNSVALKIKKIEKVSEILDDHGKNEIDNLLTLLSSSRKLMKKNFIGKCLSIIDLFF